MKDIFWKKQWKAGIFLCLFFASGLLALYFREFLGIDLEDEVYHVSSVYQVLQGKIPLMSIWDGHTGYFLLAPLGMLYQAFVPSLDGVVLYFRLTGFTIALAAAVINIHLLNKKYQDKNIVFYLLPMVFLAPVLRLNYNSISALLLSCACVLLYTSESEKSGWGRCLTAGILSGLVCLNYPTFAVIAVFLAFYVFFKNRNGFQIKRSAAFAAGVAVVGIIFFIWIFAEGSVEEFQAAMRAVLNAPHTKFRGPVNWNFFYRTFIVGFGRFFCRPYILMFLIYLTALFLIWKKAGTENRKAYALSAYALFALASVLPNRTGYGFAIFGLVIGAAAMLAMLGEKYQREHFLFYAVEFLFVLVYSFTSDNKNVLLGVSASAPFLAMVLCMFLYEHIGSAAGKAETEEEADEGKCRRRYAVFCMILTAVGLLHSYGYIYGDANFLRYSPEPVRAGAFRGMFTTAEKKEYLDGLETFADKNIHSGDRLCVVTLEPSVYLMSDASMYTPWTFDAQYLFKGFYDADPLLDYFKQYKELPDVLVGTGRKNEDLLTNPKYEIAGFISEYYILADEERAADTDLWAWRLKEGK